ncbi:hypothetical protein BJ742DRAFT_856239 [Cladochytrium replicatum]|nr:hypothetical protein BJ742DRAFT_856239 [Cladochytrium replicatum]
MPKQYDKAKSNQQPTTVRRRKNSRSEKSNDKGIAQHKNEEQVISPRQWPVRSRRQSQSESADDLLNDRPNSVLFTVFQSLMLIALVTMGGYLIGQEAASLQSLQKSLQREARSLQDLHHLAMIREPEDSPQSPASPLQRGQRRSFPPASIYDQA